MSIRHHIVANLLALVLLGSGATAIAQPSNVHVRTIDRTEALTPATRVTVENLVGHVDVTQGGRQLVIHAKVVAGGKNDAAAEALADTISLTVSRDGDQLTVHVGYPVDTHDTYQYIPTSTGSDQHKECGLHILGLHIGGCYSSSSLAYQGHQVRVYQGRDEGVPLHVDLTLKLPAHSHVKVVNQVGSIHASNLDNTLALQTDSGDVVASRTRGRLDATVDSGDVQATDHQGDLRVHTDSGDVVLRQLAGNIDVDTDSGDLKGEDLHGDTLRLHTSNGDIRLHGIRGRLDISTDSGDIHLDQVQQVSRALIKTDNGDIRMGGDLWEMHDFHITSDSGDIRLSTSRPPAVHLDIDADDIHVNWPDQHDVRSGRHSYKADFGTASGSGRISTDNGNVVLSR